MVSLEILEVFKGDIQIGETISLLEPYYIIEGVLYTHSNYMPSFAYQEYIFFLSRQIIDWGLEEWQGAFPILNGTHGRFRIPNDITARQDFSIEYFSMGRTEIFDAYMNLWQEVMDAFMN